MIVKWNGDTRPGSTHAAKGHPPTSLEEGTVATSAENPEKISANEGSMEALIKRRRQLIEELAALGRSPFCVLI